MMLAVPMKERQGRKDGVSAGCAEDSANFLAASAREMTFISEKIRCPPVSSVAQNVLFSSRHQARKKNSYKRSARHAQSMCEFEMRQALPPIARGKVIPGRDRPHQQARRIGGAAVCSRSAIPQAGGTLLVVRRLCRAVDARL